MTFEKFLATYIEYKFITPQKMCYLPKNTYYELVMESRKQQKSEQKKEKALIHKVFKKRSRNGKN
jgi:hypothetical protein